jgi:hypothetical protein
MLLPGVMHKVNDLKTALMIKEISKEGEPEKGLRRATVACSSCWPALATIGAISIFRRDADPWSVHQRRLLRRTARSQRWLVMLTLCEDRGEVCAPASEDDDRPLQFLDDGVCLFWHVREGL